MEGMLNIFLVTEMQQRMLLFSVSKFKVKSSCIKLQLCISSDVYKDIFVIWEI